MEKEKRLRKQKQTKEEPVKNKLKKRNTFGGKRIQTLQEGKTEEGSTTLGLKQREKNITLQEPRQKQEQSYV